MKSKNNVASGAKGSRKSHARSTLEQEAQEWASATTSAILLRLSKRKQSKKAEDRTAKAMRTEALRRSAALSTSSDAKGVSFRGAVFQELYVRTKWSRRFLLVFRLFAEALVKKGSFATAVVTLAQSPAEAIAIACWGGGPGSDGAGAALAFEKLVLPIAERNRASAGAKEKASASTADVPVAVSVTILDRENTWARVISTLQERLPARTTLAFLRADITEERTQTTAFAAFRWNKEDATLSHAHIHIFSYVVHETSEACMASGYAFFQRLAVSARVGAIFIFLDTVGENGVTSVARAVAAMRKALMQESALGRELQSLELAGLQLRSSIYAVQIVKAGV